MPATFLKKKKTITLGWGNGKVVPAETLNPEARKNEGFVSIAV